MRSTARRCRTGRSGSALLRREVEPGAMSRSRAGRPATVVALPFDRRPAARVI